MEGDKTEGTNVRWGWRAAPLAVLMLAAGTVAAAGSAAGASADAYWFNMGCGPSTCTVVANGDHTAGALQAPADGKLYVEGALVGTCYIPAGGGGCHTQGPGQAVQEGHCAHATAETDPTNGAIATDKDSWCNDGSGGGIVDPPDIEGLPP